MKRIFCVQPYGLKRRKIVASGAIVFDDRDEALSAGRRLAGARTGVVVLSQDIDAGSGMLRTPQVMAIHGRVPAPWRAMTVASSAA